MKLGKTAFCPNCGKIVKVRASNICNRPALDEIDSPPIAHVRYYCSICNQLLSTYLE